MPMTHRSLRAAMQTLGYKAKDGLCVGISSMAMQAFLRGDLETFNKRLAILEKLTAGEMQQLKACAIGQEIVTTDGSKLSPLELLAFFDGVGLYQNPSDYRDIGFGNMQDAQKIAYYLSEDPNNTPICVDSFCGAYTRDEVDVYLELLKFHLTVPTALLLSSGNHQINLNFDPTKQTWYFIDANSLPTQMIKSNRVSTPILAFKIHQAFEFGDYVFNTQIFTRASQVSSLEKDIVALKASPAWLIVHQHLAKRGS